MDAIESKVCANCGTLAASPFCPQCGQHTSVGEPTLRGLLTEAVSAFASFDSRLFRTLKTLVLQPGALTEAYLSGQKVNFSSPFQLFLSLEAIAFLVNRWQFDLNERVSDTKSKDLLALGVAVTVVLTVLQLPFKRNAIVHVVFMTHVWSFLMLVLMFEYATLPAVEAVVRAGFPTYHLQVGLTATAVAVGVMIFYFPAAMKRVYKEGLASSVLKTLLIVAFSYFFDLALIRLVHPGLDV